MTDDEIFSLPFDTERHKQNFKNYLEIIIMPNGTAEYAVPSHQEKLITIACRQKNITRDELNAMCPREYYCDFLTWLCMITGCVSVWDNFFFGHPNALQKAMLKELSDNRLYTGKLSQQT